MVAAAAFDPGFLPDDLADGFAGRARSGASCDKTVFFEQIGQSAVKRL
jgi:hypothetical protein